MFVNKQGYINVIFFQRKVIDYSNTKCFSEILAEPSCVGKSNDVFDFAPTIKNLSAGRIFGTFNILTPSRITRQIIFFPSRQTATKSRAIRSEGLYFKRPLRYWFEFLLS